MLSFDIDDRPSTIGTTPVNRRDFADGAARIESAGRSTVTAARCEGVEKPSTGRDGDRYP